MKSALKFVINSNYKTIKTKHAATIICKKMFIYTLI